MIVRTAVENACSRAVCQQEITVHPSSLGITGQVSEITCIVRWRRTAELRGTKLGRRASQPPRGGRRTNPGRPSPLLGGHSFCTLLACALRVPALLLASRCGGRIEGATPHRRRLRRCEATRSRAATPARAPRARTSVISSMRTAGSTYECVAASEQVPRVRVRGASEGRTDLFVHERRRSESS